MSIERKDVENIAHLARLHLDEGDVEEVTASLANILALVDQMGQADTRGVAPLAHPLDASQRLREDEVTEENRRDELQKIAPSVERGLFLVPKVID